ncbi:S24 family peptidase [Arcobacter sp.]|uniref:S24 family peptidase n=1 Tax=unclassified Arcobacter TaxID=2593671 RepID=UPI003AFFB5C5
MKKKLEDFQFAYNLRRIMNHKNITGENLGELLGVTKGTVIHWANGTRFPKEESIRKLVEVLKISYDDLFWGEEKLTMNKKIPLIGLAHCGEPAIYDLNGYEPINVPDNIYKEGMYAVKVEGDSMLPKIANGDILYCLSESKVHINSGDIVHYKLDEDSGVKKYKINENETIISLIPLNSDYEVINIHCDDIIELSMAKVIGSYREF